MFRLTFSFILQFLMFYACSLDPENCGVKFGSKLLDIFLSSNKPRPTRQVSLWSKLSHSLHDTIFYCSKMNLVLFLPQDECSGLSS